MTTFDDRKDAFENKFAHDQEIEFKVYARSTKLLARWAAAKMGMAEIDAKLYATKMVEADQEHKGDGNDVAKRLMADFEKAGIVVSARELAEEMEKQLTLAREQVMSGI